jgi:hypothetical protein
MPDEIRIVTNNVPRNVLRWHELTDKQRAEFSDYIDTEAKQDEAEFMLYRGVVYDLHDMERQSAMPEQFAKWDNYLSDSYFSGILIRWVDEGERVIAATWFC